MPAFWLRSTADNTVAELLDDVLIALRRILRATSLHSRSIGREAGVSGPQLMVLREIQRHDGATASEVAKSVSLSQATLTNIVTSLEKNGLVLRERSTSDRRRIHMSLTDDGQDTVARAPQPLQDRFARRFQELATWEQYQLLSSLERIAEMMNVEDLDAAPLLTHDADIK